MTGKVDLRILERVLRAIATGQYEALKQKEREFWSLYTKLKDARTSDEDDELDLASVLTDNPQLLTETIVATAEETLAFVQQELDRFGKIKKHRPLTNHEKRIGHECLLPLLSDLSDLLKGFRR